MARRAAQWRPLGIRRRALLALVRKHAATGRCRLTTKERRLAMAHLPNGDGYSVMTITPGGDAGQA